MVFIFPLFDYICFIKKRPRHRLPGTLLFEVGGRLLEDEFGYRDAGGGGGFHYHCSGGGERQRVAVGVAEVHAVEPDGHFVLRREDGMLSRYAFKEVKFVI